MKIKLLKTIISTVALCLASTINAQTTGTLTASFTEVSKSPTYNGSAQHALAVWIEDNAGVFVKTKLRYCCGGSTFDHLPTWSVNSGGTASNASTGNVVDATTGATKSSWGTVSVTWDGAKGPAGTGTLQPDGVYKFAIQSTWAHGTSGTATNTFTFTKGPSVNSQTITTNTTWSNIILTWTPSTPTTTGIYNNSVQNSGITVYPNPTNGILTVDYKNTNNIKIVNALGVLVYEEKMETITSGTKSINLSNCSNGIYFINVSNEKGNVYQKVILDK